MNVRLKQNIQLVFGNVYVEITDSNLRMHQAEDGTHIYIDLPNIMSVAVMYYILENKMLVCRPRSNFTSRELNSIRILESELQKNIIVS